MADVTNQTDLNEVLRESVTAAVGNIVHAMEPQLNDMATKAANQAIDKSRDVAQVAFKNVRRQPWYLVGAAAMLLIGAAILIGFDGGDLSDDLSDASRA